MVPVGSRGSVPELCSSSSSCVGQCSVVLSALGCCAVNLALHFKASFSFSLTLGLLLCVTLWRGKLLQSLFSTGEACLSSHLLHVSYMYLYIHFISFLLMTSCVNCMLVPGAFHFISLQLPSSLLRTGAAAQEQQLSFHTGAGPLAPELLGAGCVALRNGSNLFEGCDKSPGVELQQLCSPSCSSVAFPIAACLFSLLVLK